MAAEVGTERAASGFWGPASSTIDWCEANYIVTFYVAEFFNSTTSLFIVAAGLVPLLLHRHLWDVLEARYALAFLSVAVVGIGSVAFHGTLQFRHQMWDEVPMLWTVVLVLYCLVEHDVAKPRYGLPLQIVLAAYAALATWATSQQGGDVQWFSFHTFFAAVEFPCLYLVYRFFGSLDKSEEALRLLLRRGFTCYGMAIVVWLTDLNYCEALKRLPGYDYWNLHAFGWHLLTSCGLYAMLMGIWYHRLKCVLAVDVKLSVCGGVPVLLRGKGV